MTFSIYVPSKIFSADPCLIPLLLLSYTTENREVSSAKKLQLILCSLTNHLCILEKSGPRPDPSGTTAFTGNDSEVSEICLLKNSE